MSLKIDIARIRQPGFVFKTLAVILFIVLPILSLDAGISGDEPVHYEHAGFVHEYFASGGSDTKALNTPSTNLKYYGQFFDNLSYAVNDLTGTQHPYQWRHVMNALAGALLILVAGLLAVQLGGYPAGILTLIFLFLSPRILGHSYNNLKDIPFALGYILTIYGLAAFLSAFPRFNWKSLFPIGLGIAIAFGTRAGGLVLIPIVFFFGLLAWSIHYREDMELWSTLEKGLALFGILLIPVVAGYFAGILYWPYALENPLTHPWKALQMMTHYEVSIRTVFEGNWLWSENLPWYYGLKWMILSSPLLILAGFFIFPFVSGKVKPVITAMLIFSVVFPLFWTIVRDANLYGGWRHLLFLYPPLAALSAVAWIRIYANFRQKWVKRIWYLVVISGLSGPFWHIVKSHPVEYVYFNQLSGGSERLAGQYETDYYYHAIRKALAWIEKNEDPKPGCKIASNFPIAEYREFIQTEFTPVYCQYYNRGKVDWDYGIFSSTYIDPQQLAAGFWPAEEPMYSIRVENQPVCVVVKRGSGLDLEALAAYRQSDFVRADSLYRQHLTEQPHHETSLLYLAWTNRHLGEFQTADSLADQLLIRHPLSDLAYHLKAMNAISTRRFTDAEDLLEKQQSINYKFLPAYGTWGELYHSLGNPSKAAQYLEKGYRLGLRDTSAINLLINCLETSGNTIKAEKFRTILKK